MSVWSRILPLAADRGRLLTLPCLTTWPRVPLRGSIGSVALLAGLALPLLLLLGGRTAVPLLDRRCRIRLLRALMLRHRALVRCGTLVAGHPPLRGLRHAAFRSASWELLSLAGGLSRWHGRDPMVTGVRRTAPPLPAGTRTVVATCPWDADPVVAADRPTDRSRRAVRAGGGCLRNLLLGSALLLRCGRVLRRAVMLSEVRLGRTLVRERPRLRRALLG